VPRGGRLQQVGSPDELYLRPANLFVAGFIGSPAMNFVAGTVRDGVIELPFARLPLSERLKPAFELTGGADSGHRTLSGARRCSAHRRPARPHDPGTPRCAIEPRRRLRAHLSVRRRGGSALAGAVATLAAP
jgi:hypothetical protein